MTHMQTIPVTLLQVGDTFCSMHQVTGELDTDTMRRVTRAPRVDHNTGSIYVGTDEGRADYLNGATVARRVR